MRGDWSQNGGAPVGQRLGAEELRIDDGHDGHGHAGVRQVDAADAAIVLQSNRKEVLIGEVFGVAGRLERGHCELVRL